jgi:prepilin-type processing-associated H-X9-DG protein
VTSNDIVAQVIRSLDQLGIPHMLVGSYSSNMYGVARSTKDADFVVQLPNDSTNSLATILGADFHLDPQAVLEFNTFTTRFIVRHITSAFSIELFLLSDDAHDQERFRRRVQVAFLDGHAWMPTAEDVVIMKVRWAQRSKRSKDMEDALNVLAVQRGRLDLAYIRRWCDLHGTRQLLEDLLAMVPADL